MRMTMRGMAIAACLAAAGCTTLKMKPQGGLGVGGTGQVQKKKR